MRPLDKRKLLAGFASAAGAAVLALASLTAGAVAAPNPGPPQNSNPDGPQTANVPYVAWVGEHVRLVVCDPSINPDGFENIQFANFAVEDWSGYQFQPPTPDGDSGNSLGQIFDPGPAAFFASSEPSHQGDGCVATDYKSLNPGLSRIRVDVRNDETGAIVFSHQFLVIWLTTNAPTLAEAGLTENTNGEKTIQSQANPSALANFLGDPAGDGKFIPSPFNPETATNEDKGLIQIKVTGSFPIVKESPLSNILTNASYTLPNEWATLAETLASSSEEEEPPGSNPGLWDIHGTPIEATTSNEGSATNDPLHNVFFRPAFGNNTSGETATVGPFDPQAANETLLSDNKLNADDAPMPALRIDVRMAKNEGGSDLGGVGQIAGASKAQVYSHDLKGNTDEPQPEGNLYNPYYGAYIPATDRPVNEASGIAGPSPGGDFPGFLNKHSEPYTFWNAVRSGEYLNAESTGCLRRTDAQPSEYQTPEGFRSETFYTDERGEVYLTYTPGDGFYLNHIPVFAGAEGESEEGKIVQNENGGCDLKGLFGKTIGESSISATAVYPYEPVDYPAVKSVAPVVKTVSSSWEKEWFEFPKGNGKEEANVKIIVAKAQDIDGYPIVGEKVCFHAEQNSGLKPYSGISGYIKDPGNLLGKGTPVYVGGSSVDGGQEGTAFLCVVTNREGLATVEVENSSFGKVDLTAVYEEEHIYRDHEILFPTNAGGLKEAEEAKAGKQKEEEAEAKQDEEEIKKLQEEEAAKNKAREEESTAAETKHQEEEAANNKKREEEVAEKLKTKEKAEEEAAAEKTKHAEEAAAEKTKHEEEAAAEKKKHEEEAASLAKAAMTTTTNTAPLYTPIAGVLGVTAAKPLTEAQKRAKALAACKKLPKKKRAACEAQVRGAHSAKHKKHKKK